MEIEPGKYVPYDHWDNYEYDGYPLPSSARPVTRFLKGSFVFFSTRSFYNGNRATYDARHNAKTEDEFRDYIRRSAESVAVTEARLKEQSAS